EVAGVVVRGPSGERADLVEAAGIEQGVDALAHRHLPLRAVPLDLLLTAHAVGHLGSARQLLELRLPARRARAHAIAVITAGGCPSPPRWNRGRGTRRSRVRRSA